jgi:hypothetical protein
MKTSKFGNYKEGGYYLFLIPFTSEKLTERKIILEWDLWYRKSVWHLLPSLTLSYTGINNIYLAFDFLKFKFSLQWFDWDSKKEKK